MNTNIVRSSSVLTIAALTILPTLGSASGSWQALPDYPVPIANNAVTSVANDDGSTTIYSMMGINDPSDPESITAASYRLTWPDGQWEAIAEVPLLDGRARIAASAVTVAGEVYLLGGYAVTDSSEVTDPRLFQYDPDADEWLDISVVPIEVDDTVAAVIDDRYIVLVSGWHGPINDNVTAVQVYDTNDSTWHSATPIPDPEPGLFGHAGGAVGDQLIYFDGVDSNGFRISDRVFMGRFQEVDGCFSVSWTEIAAHPGAATYRAAASLGADNERLVVVGGTNNPFNFDGIGYNGQPSEPLDQVLTFEPSTQQWFLASTDAVHEPTMDHRGLVAVGDCWAVVGGQTGPGVATTQVSKLCLGATEHTLWIPVAAHAQGVGTSRWRSDLSLASSCGTVSEALLRLHTDSGVHETTVEVPTSGHLVLDDVVGLFLTGSDEDLVGAIEITTTEPVSATTRSWTEGAGGSLGQSIESVESDAGLRPGQTASVHPLREDSAFRSNLSFLNMGVEESRVLVTLSSETGGIGGYLLTLPAQSVTHDLRPFANRFNRQDVTAGFASVRMVSGGGVVVLASVIDNNSQDPTTVKMAVDPNCR